LVRSMSCLLVFTLVMIYPGCIFFVLRCSRRWFLVDLFHIVNVVDWEMNGR
jgi:hypothetical protein